jgi:prevent-host-death family protein
MISPILKLGLKDLQRGALGELASRVHLTGARAVVLKHGRPVCAIVSLADLEQLEATAAAPQGIPDDERTKIVEALTKQGLPVTEEHIFTLYQRAHPTSAAEPQKATP